MSKRGGEVPSGMESIISNEPISVTRFEDIKDKPEVEPELNDFEPVFKNSAFREHSFEETRKAFLFVFDREKVRQYLSIPQPTKEAFRYLKRVRRFGLILRDNYKLLDSSHSSPESLHNFLSALGSYNDHYWLSEGQDVSSLLETLGGVDESDLVIKQLPDKDFMEYARNLLEVINSLLQRDELPTKQFHELRKNIRVCADLMQVAAAEDYGGKMHWLFSSVLALSVKLGDKHDELVQRDLRNELDYKNTTVPIEPEVRRQFEELKPFMEKTFGITRDSE